MKLQNKKMNNEVYKLRREAMKFIYEAKEITDLPRITIRIIEDESKLLGAARLGTNEVWICERAVRSSKYDLRTIVFHELLHAVYSIGHDLKCPLMKPTHTPLSKGECHRLFKKWIGA